MLSLCNMTITEMEKNIEKAVEKNDMKELTDILESQTLSHTGYRPDTKHVLKSLDLDCPEIMIYLMKKSGVYPRYLLEMALQMDKPFCMLALLDYMKKSGLKHAWTIPKIIEETTQKNRVRTLGFLNSNYGRSFFSMEDK